MRFAIVLALSGIVSGTASASPELQSSATPHAGIRRETWREPTIPARVFVIEVDLTSAEISVLATQENQRGRTTTSFANAVNAQVAINGNPFAITNYTPRGLAMGAKMAWSNTADDASSAVFHFRRTADGTGERTVAGIITPEEVTTLADLPADTDGVVAGKPLLIRAGGIEANPDCADAVAIACQRAPRSALALSADGNTLWIVAVDGWQAGSHGMTAVELARFLRDTKQPQTAFALDSGGSSTLVLDGDLLNHPSDGVERPVANHLGIEFGALQTGQLAGVICKNDVIACQTDSSLRLPGAEVTLDDGRVQTVGANATYSFTNISPRLACVTVRLDGYLTRTACDYVVSGMTVFESVAMFEGEDPPDAGPFDAGPDPVPPDGLDGGLRPDGGQPGIGEGGGCCDSRRSQPPAILVGLVGFMLLRRRGTTGSR